MPRTRKYDINESIASSQATIITRVNNDNNLHGHINHVDASPVKKKRDLHIGWSVGVFIAALCITFLLCVAFIRLPGVPTERTPTAGRVLRKQGYFQIYPVPVREEGSLSARTKIITLSNTTNLIEQLRNEVNRYPDTIDLVTYTACFVTVPTYNHPCIFEREWLGSDCTVENSFGYKEVNGMINPCILLRLENTTDWQPVVYRKDEVDESWINDYYPSFSSIGCTFPGKRDNQTHSFKVFPVKGFPNEFYPASNFNKTLYLNPSIMLQLIGIPVGETINLNCWLRVSNAFMLEDDGEIELTITMTDPFMSTFSDSQFASSVTQDFNLSTTSSSPSEVTTVRRLSTTVPGLNLRENN